MKVIRLIGFLKNRFVLVEFSHLRFHQCGKVNFAIANNHAHLVGNRRIRVGKRTT